MIHIVERIGILMYELLYHDTYIIKMAFQFLFT